MSELTKRSLQQSAFAQNSQQNNETQTVSTDEIQKSRNPEIQEIGNPTNQILNQSDDNTSNLKDGNLIGNLEVKPTFQSDFLSYSKPEVRIRKKITIEGYEDHADNLDKLKVAWKAKTGKSMSKEELWNEIIDMGMQKKFKQIEKL
jgi:hypothetical protein